MLENDDVNPQVGKCLIKFLISLNVHIQTCHTNILQVIYKLFEHMYGNF